MDDLTFHLMQLARRNEDGSFKTQANRRHMLKLFARELKEGGFKLPSAGSLKPKHIAFLVSEWKTAKLSDRTIENRLCALRWWSEKIGKASVVKRRNEDYGVCGDRTPKLRARGLDRDRLAKVHSSHVQASLELQAAFGLRAEEAIKFTPAFADRGDHIQLKPSWCKGGRARSIPVTHQRQRDILDRVRHLAGNGALIEPGRNYVQQKWAYDHQTVFAGLRNNHGLRHAWAQWRYEQLSGMKCPAKGGRTIGHMTMDERLRDRAARQALSYELGHNRLEITRVYLGG
ncbi:phage integrase N-terminal domain-containing protein [uncultured Hyphomicrobium sp.]|uniref:phage integrase N-terminal domain-containing protein n=1 Tax=uncultured Hyphomicrobium sp. TaxID=194373 RepID=UPI0025FBB107|nr:phage integrase N-terminal domain-containing protein [uncultured Hyphomicrobium sp.]